MLNMSKGLCILEASHQPCRRLNGKRYLPPSPLNGLNGERAGVGTVQRPRSLSILEASVDEYSVNST